MKAETAGTVFKVQKADLPMRAGESFNDFNERLRKELIRHFIKLGLAKKIRYLWVDEVYSDKVVVSVSWLAPDDKGIEAELKTGDRHTFYQVAAKKGTDNFVFGNTVEVERKVTWMPKAKVEKSVDSGFWEGTALKED